MAKVAIQGYSGSFHEQAAIVFYGQKGLDAEIVECATFEGLFDAMDSGRADAAVMAVENTTSGGLLPNFDLIRKHNATISGEIYLPIHQNLMAVPGQRLQDITEVRTHYMAINQTRSFFEEKCPWIKMVESEDTAKSAMDIARQGLRGVGAVASSLAAGKFGLEILAEDIETYRQNATRFVVIDKSISVPDMEKDKASVCFTLPHTPGALAKVLTIFSFYGMNLTRIQSLPIPGEKWQYFFYADIKFDDYLRYAQALSAVIPLIRDLTVMGEYVSEI